MPRESHSGTSTETDLLIRQYDPEIQGLINAARSTLRAAFPGAMETADPKARLLGYSYGPGYKGTVATLLLSKKGVKIGIPFGASLPARALKALLKDLLSAWRERAGGSHQGPEKGFLPAPLKTRALGDI
ncbi:MAG TPA: hypothetical protein VGL82_03765 [Bryobacteraceae bacterium]|jgi:hypothetical protein